MSQIISESLSCGKCCEFISDGSPLDKMGYCSVRKTMVFSKDSFCLLFTSVLVCRLRQLTAVLKRNKHSIAVQ